LGSCEAQNFGTYQKKEDREGRIINESSSKNNRISV
jgi:hypothetical protein